MIALALLLASAEPALSAPAAEVVAQVEGAIAEVRDRHAKLPPATDDRERLERMGELDQAARRVVTSTDFSKIPPQERPAMMRKVSAAMAAVDRENQAALLEMVPPEGWFLKSRYGEKAANAAFLVVQHADLQMQQRFLPVLAPLVKTGEVEGQSYGLMYDRVAIQLYRPQRYGSQFRCDGGKWRPYPLEDEARVDEFRAELGFKGFWADYKAYFDKAPPCPQTERPPPRGMKLD